MYYIHPKVIYHRKEEFTNPRFAKTNFFYTSRKKKYFILKEVNEKRQTFPGLLAGVLRLIALCESLAGVIIFIRIAVLAMGLLQYCLYLSVIPPDCGTDCDKGKEAQSENAPHGYGKRNGDIECSESGQQGDEQ